MAEEAFGGPHVTGKKYATPAAFRRALEDRIAAIAKSEAINLQRIRRQIAFDRLLGRLFAGPTPAWLLKGGYALELKLSAARTTKDIDLGLDRLPGTSGDWNQSAHELWKILQQKAALVSGDYFEFTIGEPTVELDAAPYSGARFPVESIVAGKTFAEFHLDVGAGDVQREPTEVITPRDWLAFAGIPASPFPSICREEHFAQKMLRRDISDTFARRKTHDFPAQLESPPAFWSPTFARMASECSLDGDIVAQFEKLKEFCTALHLN